MIGWVLGAGPWVASALVIAWCLIREKLDDRDAHRRIRLLIERERVATEVAALEAWTRDLREIQSVEVFDREEWTA